MSNQGEEQMSTEREIVADVKGAIEEGRAKMAELQQDNETVDGTPEAEASDEVTQDQGTDEVPESDPAEAQAEVSEEPESESEEPESETDDRQVRKAQREAGKYRLKLREAEAERDALQEQVRQLRQRDVTAEFNKKLEPEVTAMLWGIGLDPLSFVGEDGQLDQDKITNIIAEVGKVAQVRRDGAESGKPKPVLKKVLVGGAKPGEMYDAPKKSWDDVMKGRAS